MVERWTVAGDLNEKEKANPFLPQEFLTPEESLYSNKDDSQSCLEPPLTSLKKSNKCRTAKGKTSKVGDSLRRSLKMSGKGRILKGNTLKVGDPMNMWRAVMTNLVEERRNKLYVEKLQKILNIWLREIEREKAALDKFLAKLYRTTGYFPEMQLW
ncbi:hypothetical protein GW7_19869 [Heterocephalus glaber]|uniref:Uncharacterized protein n=1 Tax=Heterocephalus glaber TaxID=10181 RepID=G5BJP6_HETGA|nr:hypothetical protein GW7_19869 [Heterocephalus glaber]